MEMNRAAGIEDMVGAIRRRTLLDKYGRDGGATVLEALNLPLRLNRFSWGGLYLLLAGYADRLCGAETEEIAVSVELLCLSSKILDDLADGDNPALADAIGESGAVFLFTDLLVDCLRRLNRVSEEPDRLYAYLQEALHGEWIDVSRTAFDGMDEERYMTEILPKSAAFFKIVAFLADPGRREFWEAFCDSAAAATQLLNDLHGVFSEGKSDLARLRPTLPLIKALDMPEEYGRAETARLLRGCAAGDVPQEAARERLAASGALEYCAIIREMHKERCAELLRTRFPEEQERNARLLDYLGLGPE